LSAAGERFTTRDRQALDGVRRAVRQARRELETDSEWGPALTLLEEELVGSQPFFLRVRSASDKRSMSETPVVST
jgi:hypothetical protein